MPERKTFLMTPGLPDNFISPAPDLDLDPDARPKVGQHVGAEGGYEHPGEVFQMESGIWALEPGTLRTWIKLAGEPAETLYETPDVFHQRWKAFVGDESQFEVWFHTHTDGVPFAIYRPGIPHVWKFGITFQSTPPRPVRRSVYAGNCGCPVCLKRD